MVPPTSAIADVLQLRGLMGWLSPPLVPIHRTPAVIGAARTVTLAAGSGPEGLKPLHRLLDEDLEGRIVVIAGATAAEGAVWGEILTRAAQNAGALAALIDGGVRDTDAARDLDFPLWARHEATAGPGPRVHVAAVGTPVHINGVLIADGDTLVVDRGGVVTVPGPEILTDATEYTDAEEEVVNALREGTPLHEAYTHKANLVAKLRSRNSGSQTM
ncbi:RraA family protein [Sinosporangium siamense]|uniref:Putative 4-hydroxy-4-methyl-2-oxoglutarate aldolase n=1 Tax=Sinosporangium siamense TaxID=1367973 RepID=A0A919RIS6_9ACTN|nr:RraA family protein [Sinosporangium siamense]GII94588.1 hypothetical protein Ssi02_48190 [Sinosporangium siamense]